MPPRAGHCYCILWRSHQSLWRTAKSREQKAEDSLKVATARVICISLGAKRNNTPKRAMRSVFEAILLQKSIERCSELLTVSRRRPARSHWLPDQLRRSSQCDTIDAASSAVERISVSSARLGSLRLVPFGAARAQLLHHCSCAAALRAAARAPFILITVSIGSVPALPAPNDLDLHPCTCFT